MSQPSSIHLKFCDKVDPAIRARISYTFRIFAAVYGHIVVEDESDADPEVLRCFYGEKPPKSDDALALFVPARYQIRRREQKRPGFTRRRYAQEDYYLLYGIDDRSGNPDWLGEIFDWVSSSHEMGITPRDGIGRVPYSEMVFCRQEIPPQKPHALLLMAWMENSLRWGNSKEELPRAESPVEGVEHIVVCSHDIDFYYASWVSTLVRLIKNLGISYHPYRSWSYFRKNSGMIFDLLGGKKVGDFLPRLLEAGSENGFCSTLFVVSGHKHRRDPNYGLEHLAPHLAKAAKRGFPTSLHGSYSSVMGGGELQSEAAALDRAVGKNPLGNRQHWLRFDQHERLFRCVENAQLRFDSTLGFSDRVGYRNGASFAFPPYDFTNERAYEFLEIPLVLMDWTLEATSRSTHEEPQEIAEKILQESRRRGWGGIAALWHNPIEPLAVPGEINDVFWKCVKSQQKFNERWVSAEEFLEKCLYRYQNAGLMKRVRARA
jgi:hypothetical protein